jgi:hypothetical protein
MRWLIALAILIPVPLPAGSASDLARAIRENSFDRDQCYRVRDVTINKDDFRIYLTDGHLIFSKPVAGRRIAAVFAADVDGGDAEVILLPPDRAERRSLANFIKSPNLDEHFGTALFLFTGDDYDAIMSQLPQNPANRKASEMGPLMDEEWTPTLHNISASYQTRLTLDLLSGPSRRPGLFAAVFNNSKLGNFDIAYDPDSQEQILAGQIANRDNRAFFDTWTSFQSRAFRKNPAPLPSDLRLQDYRLQATINPDLSVTAITRVKVSPLVDGMVAALFDIAPDMSISEVTVEGRPAEVLQRDSMRSHLTRGGNDIFLVVPPEPLRAGRDYEFEFHHSGNVILDAGGVLYVTARGNWYPMHGLQFSTYDLVFRYPRNLDLVAPGDVVEDRTEGEWRITHRRPSATIRFAAFNLGDYEHARMERSGYAVDICANRTLEAALKPKPQPPVMPPVPVTGSPRRRREDISEPITLSPPPAPDPLAKLHILASQIASALEYMVSRFGPPALPHLAVSPIPGTFGQGFPGLIYLSTLAYLKNPPVFRGASLQSQEIYFDDVLAAHETAHQWWGNRVVAATYRDYWLMEALANYSALLYLEKSKGARPMEIMLDSYRTALLARTQNEQTVESAGPIVLGLRLENSQEPRAWRIITYGKGSWIMQMLRRQMGDERFFAMLTAVLQRYDRKEISTEQFRAVAAQFMPPKSDDPELESFFDQWIYGTGIPSLKLVYTVKGKAPALRLVGTLTQTDADEDFTTLVPVEIQVARGRTVTRWVRSGSSPTSFTVGLKEPPLKVSLDPHQAVLRR